MSKIDIFLPIFWTVDARFFLLRTGKIGWSKYYHAAGASEQGSPERSPGLPKCDTYKFIYIYAEGFLLSIAVKEGKKLWACLEIFHFCAPEYYRAGTRMAAQQQQKSYNRPLHFFPYKIDILSSPKSY